MPGGRRRVAQVGVGGGAAVAPLRPAGGVGLVARLVEQLEEHVRVVGEPGASTRQAAAVAALGSGCTSPQPKVWSCMDTMTAKPAARAWATPSSTLAR